MDEKIMENEFEKYIKEAMDKIAKIDSIKLSDLPNIDLYMDQLTTFMDEHLENTTRHPGDDKILTKTMINNYAKNDLLPPPLRKKYSKEHVILLIFIYYFKSVLSINDIQTLIEPLKERFHVSDIDEISLTDIYKTIFEKSDETIELFSDDMKKKIEISKEMFKDGSDKESTDLQLFSFLSILSFDVYIKKMIIENILDNIRLAKENDIKQKKEADKKAKKEKDKK